MDLQERIWFTIGALVVFRLGTYIPVPGFDPQVLAELLRPQTVGILSLLDFLTGGALGRMSLFALGLLPYLSAVVILQLAIAVSRRLKALGEAGVAGRKAVYQYVRYGTLLLCIIQSGGLAFGLEHLIGPSGPAVFEPGAAFRVTTVATLTAGGLLLMWLSEQITDRGIGNGAALILASGAIAMLPTAVAEMLWLARHGALPVSSIMIVFLGAAAIGFLIVFVESAERRILTWVRINPPKTSSVVGRTSSVPLKVNSAGLLPPVLAASLLLVPLSSLGLVGWSGGDRSNLAGGSLGIGQGLIYLLYAVLIALFALFFARRLADPAEMADDLVRRENSVPGIRPGRHTAAYLNFIHTRVTAVGAGYLALVCVLPDLLLHLLGVPLPFAGIGVLIVVVVTLQILRWIRSRRWLS